MTYQEIRDAIAASPGLQAMQDAGNTQGIAESLSTGRTKHVVTLGGVGHVLSTLGADAGAAVLDTLDGLKAGNAALKWAWVLLERGELDFGDAQVQAMIQTLATGGAMTQAQADALIASAEVADPIHWRNVSKAIKGYV